MSIYYLGEIEQRQNRWPEAISYYQRVFVAYQKYLPWAAKAYLHSAEAFDKLGKRPEAIAHLQEMLRNEKLKDFPETAQGRKMLADWGCRMKTALLILALAASASAQTLLMKDGKTVATKGVRRQGDTILATIQLPAQPGQPAKTGELGYALAQITRIDFPEPPVLRTVPELIGQGKTEEALTQLQPWLRYYESIHDAPGSWWAPIAMLEWEALESLGRPAEADAFAQRVAQLATDPETSRSAALELAYSSAYRGDAAKAQPICEAALKQSKDPAVLALAATTEGECLLAAHQEEDALLAFLQVPVFYPEQKALLPPAMLGAGRAHFAMDDFPGARTAFNELIADYAGSASAAEAKAELEKIARREKALAPP